MKRSDKKKLRIISYIIIIIITAILIILKGGLTNSKYETVRSLEPYDINIVDISECPPKVSIAIKAKDKYSFIEFFRVSYDSGEQVVSRITGILERKAWEEVVEKK